MILATDFYSVDNDLYTSFMIGDRIYFVVSVNMDESEKMTRLHSFVAAYNLGFVDGMKQGQQEQADKIRQALMLPSVDTLNNF